MSSDTERTFAEFAVRVVMRNEGGLLTDAAAEALGDPGGVTNYGLTAATLKALGVTVRPEDLTAEMAQALYHTHYWAVPGGPIRVATVSPAMALAFMDASVQHGLGNASRMLQLAVGAKADGAVGAKTLEALESAGEGTAVVRFHEQRRKLVAQWVAKSAKRLALLVGMLRRIDLMERQAFVVLVEDQPNVHLTDVFGAGRAL